MDLSAKIEAILFWKAEPVSLAKLASLLETDLDNLRQGIDRLEHDLRGRGLSIVQTDDEVMLGTASAASSLIERLTKEEVSRDLGKAGLETISIILYRGPIGRTDIEYIRGVNSQFILRNLLVRGLIERVLNPADARSYLYKTTLDLLSHLGLKKVGDLPGYEQVRKNIDTFRRSMTDEMKQNEAADVTIEE
ncbi:MAG: segregation and condensation protein [Candidatus Parcubacteria bacterium]|jgi:segregation and condensation protein B|nr:segregation and condensation protein [Candidatus Parcubacteria bacterium]